MEINKNKDGTVSLFLPQSIISSNGNEHRGFICESETAVGAKSKASEMVAMFFKGEIDNDQFNVIWENL